MQIDHAMNLIFSKKKEVFLYLLPIFDKFHNLFLATNSIDTHHYEINYSTSRKKMDIPVEIFLFSKRKDWLLSMSSMTYIYLFLTDFLNFQKLQYYNDNKLLVIFV